MTRVLLDANALMMPVELGVRIFDELDRLLGGPDERFGPTGVPIQASIHRDSSAERSAATGGEPDRTPDPESDSGPAGRGAGGTESDANRTPVDGVTLLVPTAVRRELDDLSGGHSEAEVAASVGADLAGERCRELPHEASHADDAIVELATDRRAVIDYVLTNDRALRERLSARGVPVICLRGHDQLTITNP
jgi:rRNA-processing protein FCF1